MGTSFPFPLPANVRGRARGMEGSEETKGVKTEEERPCGRKRDERRFSTQLSCATRARARERSDSLVKRAYLGRRGMRVRRKRGEQLLSCQAAAPLNLSANLSSQSEEYPPASDLPWLLHPPLPIYSSIPPSCLASFLMIVFAVSHFVASYLRFLPISFPENDNDDRQRRRIKKKTENKKKNIGENYCELKKILLRRYFGVIARMNTRGTYFR